MLPVLTRSVQSFGRDEIAALPARTLSEVLEWAMGAEVQSRSPAQSDLSIRGSGFEEVVVLVDGVRVSDPQTGHFDLDVAVPLDQIQRIEILRGPASAVYGADAVGGVVNLVTTGGDGRWQGRVEGGSWETSRFSLGGGFEGPSDLSVRVGAETSRSDGHRQGTDYETTLAHVGLTRGLGAGRASGSLGFALREFGARDFYAPFPSFETTHTYTGAFQWEEVPVGRLTVETGLSFRRHEDDFVLNREDPSFYRNRHTSSQVGGELLARGAARPGIDLVFGGELFRDLLRSSNLGDRGEFRGALLGEIVLQSGSRVFSLGLREDWHEGFGSFFAPSLSGSYRVGASLRVRGAVGRSFRAPTWTERYYTDPLNVGREDLAPERSWSGELGIDLHGIGGVRFSATGFLRRTEGLIDWARVKDSGSETPWETRNVETADFLGLEGEVMADGPWETRLALGGSVLTVDSKEAAGLESKYALRPLVQKVTLAFRREFGTWGRVGVNGQRGKREGEDPFHRIDLRAGVRIGPAWVYLDANNLTDATYPDITGAAAPGRAFFLGVELAGGGG
jgi:iron complex outermembrane receptor protein